MRTASPVGLGGEVRRRRPARQPRLVHGQHAGHRRLLEHELARPSPTTPRPRWSATAARARARRTTRARGRGGRSSPQILGPVRALPVWQPDRSARAVYRVDMPSPPLRPRGPLPARVYWTRRLVLLGIALVLVAGFARILGGSSDASGDGSEKATTAGAPTTTSPSDTADRAAGEEEEAQEEADADRAAPRRADRRVRERRHRGDAGRARGRRVVSTSRSRSTCAPCRRPPAPGRCRRRRSRSPSRPATTTSGRAGSARPRIPAQDVVVRQAVDAPIAIVWNAKRSDEDCSAFTEWARPRLLPRRGGRPRR